MVENRKLYERLNGYDEDTRLNFISPRLPQSTTLLRLGSEVRCFFAPAMKFRKCACVFDSSWVPWKRAQAYRLWWVELSDAAQLDLTQQGKRKLCAKKEMETEEASSTQAPSWLDSAPFNCSVWLTQSNILELLAAVCWQSGKFKLGLSNNRLVSAA